MNCAPVPPICDCASSSNCHHWSQLLVFLLLLLLLFLVAHLQCWWQTHQQSRPSPLWQVLIDQFARPCLCMLTFLSYLWRSYAQSLHLSSSFISPCDAFHFAVMLCIWVLNARPTVWSFSVIAMTFVGRSTF